MNSKKIIDYKKEYENIKIPENLMTMVEITIKDAERVEKVRKMKTSKKIFMRVGTIAAALAITIGAIGVGVSTNESFASSMSEVPILSGLVKIFTGSSIHTSDKDIVVNAEIPEITGMKDEALQEKINNEINRTVNMVIEDTKVIMLEAKKAWLETGGKEEDYVPMNIEVGYDAKSVDNGILSFVVWKTETLASAYFEEFYYNYDLTANKEITLEDMLGKDYKNIINEEVTAQIAERSKNPENIYFDGKDGVPGFETIADKQNFYVNEKGNPVIVFNKYEIAPGSMGPQEFEIAK